MISHANNALEMSPYSSGCEAGSAGRECEEQEENEEQEARMQNS
jgi:hypothetical protein